MVWVSYQPQLLECSLGSVHRVQASRDIGALTVQRGARVSGCGRHRDLRAA